MRGFVVGVLIFNFFAVFALNDTLFINKKKAFIYNDSVSFCSFNDSATFSTHNKHISLLLGDSLVLTLHNNDSLQHTFTIDGVSNNIVSPFTSQTFIIHFNEEGTYRYYSNTSYGKLIGASGIINVTKKIFPHYFWNLYEAETNLSHTLASGIETDITGNYTPNIFLINGYFFPNTNNDSTAKVRQNVGDTVLISIINSGNIDHILHFHGYHVEIIDIKKNVRQKNWIKDTFPVKTGEALTVMLVPDKIGMYPVHDHNLIAVTNGGLYPGGMITMLHIE